MSQNLTTKWVPLTGKVEQKKNNLVFKGGKFPLQDGEEGSEVGLFMSNQKFTGGSISTNVKFHGTQGNNAADIIFYYDPQSKLSMHAGLTSQNLFAIRQFQEKWTFIDSLGAANSIEAHREYSLEVSIVGSVAILRVDGVEVLRVTLPFVPRQSNVGVFALGQTDIEFSNFNVTAVKPRAFVVMQFSSKYDDVYSDVIKSVCEEEDVDVLRIDETAGPGIIVEDITRAIREAKIVIADISPLNANVFYEVGFAHALNKPTILLAEKDTKLPFDVSSFRTLFYENSIGGKKKFEQGLRAHIKASLKQ